MELGPLTVPLPVDFCSITYDGCTGASPACSQMKAGEEVKLCSSLTVPTQSPDVVILQSGSLEVDMLLRQL